MAGNSPLARMLAGLPAQENYSPMPKPMPKPNGGMTPWLPPFDQPGQSLPFQPQKMALPPYQQPGGSLPFDWYYRQPQAAPPPAAAPAAYRPPPAPAMPVQTGGQGYSGPEPIDLATQPQAQPDPRYLPEQWRGAFNQWQFPT
jgi:hypothetical protein